MSIDPKEINFGRISLNTSSKQKITFSNEGNSAVNYTLVPDWNLCNVIKLNESFIYSGTIDPGGFFDSDILFCPLETGFFETEILFESTVGIRRIHIVGEGVEYKLNDSLLPKEIDLGSILYGTTKEFEFEIMNGCPYELRGTCGIYKEDPSIVTDPLQMEFANVEPNSFLLPECANHEERSKANLTIKYSLDIVQDSQGNLDGDYYQTMQSSSHPQLYLCISILNGGSVVIPISFTPEIQQPQFLKDGEYDPNGEIPSESLLSNVLDFGTHPFASGSYQKIYIFNPNKFNIQFEPIIHGEEFALDLDSNTVSGNSLTSLSLQMKPIDFPEDAIVPEKQSFSNEFLDIQFHILDLKGFQCELKGTMIDVFYYFYFVILDAF